MTDKRQIKLIGFLHAEHGSLHSPSWRHRDAATDFRSPAYFQRIARTLEAGKFQMAFFDDRLAMPDIYGHSHEAAIAAGIRPVKMDPVPVLALMAGATRHLGLGATGSTTYYEPFHIARTFQTLDILSEGRAAWNVVTSINDSEAANFGLAQHLGHDPRYDRADEFMEVVLGHWNSWDDDALILDRANGRFGDGHKVRRLDHVGENFKSRGPFTVPRSPQGQPVIIQAGSSGRGRRFAARWSEVIFAAAHNLAHAQAGYKAQKDEIAAAGRDPEQVRMCNLILPVVAATKSEAEDKMALIEKLPLEVDTLSLLSEALNFDFASKPMDEAFTDDELRGMSGIQTIRDSVIRISGIANPTVRDFAKFSGRGRPDNAIIGGPKEVADHLEEMFVTRGCDGFVVSAAYVPGNYADFVDLVIPELQRRGLYHLDYAGDTLRENLGLARPAIDAWKPRK